MEQTSYGNLSFPKPRKTSGKISIWFSLQNQETSGKIEVDQLHFGLNNQMEATKLALGLHLFIFQLNLVVFAADVYSRNDFPPGFVFGAATSAFQV